MTWESFTDWFFRQPEFIQYVVCLTPSFVVFMVIGLCLGQSIRTLILAWLFNPATAHELSTALSEKLEPKDDWAEDAKEQVDELVARRCHYSLRD